ncbi:MAG TPA: glucose-6-phosphate isomerase, partial [Clostridia bacterium]|nr:glucose-6-phosphate isomerase [Clostridia bacterium]
MGVRLDTKYTEPFVSRSDIDAVKDRAVKAALLLSNKKGAGNNFLGWLNLPENYDKDEVKRIKKSAKKIRSDSDILIVIG